MYKDSIKYNLISSKDKILYLKRKRHRLQMYRQYLIEQKIIPNYFGKELPSNKLAIAYAQFENDEVRSAICTARGIIKKKTINKEE